jgi:glutaryl-CoA dehydrogenase
VWPRLAELGLGGLVLDGYGCPGRGAVLDGFVAMELASVDSSIATGLGVHSHLAMGSIHHCGSEEQKEQWLPEMARLEKIGAFGSRRSLITQGCVIGTASSHRRFRYRSARVVTQPDLADSTTATARRASSCAR